MDDLLREFLTETNESLDRSTPNSCASSSEPNNAEILGNIFRLVHTIKGTCGFLGLPRLETLAHAAETLMGKFRDGMPVTAEAVTLILSTIDRIKIILDEIEAQRAGAGGRRRRSDRAARPPGAQGSRQRRRRRRRSRSNAEKPEPIAKADKSREGRGRSDPTTSAATGSPTIRSASMSTRSII